MVDARCVPSLDIAIQYVSEGGASEQMRLVFGMRAPSTSLSYVGCGPDLWPQGAYNDRRHLYTVLYGVVNEL